MNWYENYLRNRGDEYFVHSAKWKSRYLEQTWRRDKNIQAISVTAYQQFSLSEELVSESLLIF
jgi:hypothetical protein